MDVEQHLARPVVVSLVGRPMKRSLQRRRTQGVMEGEPMLGMGLLVAASGWWFGSIVLVILWILIAFWPARVAARKGHSFFLYFLFSLVFFPAALIVAYLVNDRARPAVA
jgi:hypothetical protein